jgi:hypothetical protein
MGMAMGPGLEPAVDARAGAEGTRLDLDGVWNCSAQAQGGKTVRLPATPAAASSRSSAGT